MLLATVNCLAIQLVQIAFNTNSESHHMQSDTTRFHSKEEFLLLTKHAGYLTKATLKVTEFLVERKHCSILCSNLKQLHRTTAFPSQPSEQACWTYPWNWDIFALVNLQLAFSSSISGKYLARLEIFLKHRLERSFPATYFYSFPSTSLPLPTSFSSGCIPQLLFFFLGGIRYWMIMPFYQGRSLISDLAVCLCSPP